MSDSWLEVSVDEAPLLCDLLAGGVFGKSNADRVHSSTITLNAVAADRRGEKGRAEVLKTLSRRSNIWKAAAHG